MTGDPVPVIKPPSFRSKSRRTHSKSYSEHPSEDSDIKGRSLSRRKQLLNRTLSKQISRSPSKKSGVPSLHTAQRKSRIADERAIEAYKKRRAELKTIHHAERPQMALKHIPKDSEEYVIAQFRLKGAKVLHVPYASVAHPVPKHRNQYSTSPKKATQASISRDSSKKKSVDRHCHRKLANDEPVSDFDVEFWAKEVGVTQERKLKSKLERLIYKDQTSTTASRNVSRSRSQTHHSHRYI